MPKPPASAFAKLVTSWLGSKVEEKRWRERQVELNDQVKTLIKSHGTFDPNDGHYYYDGVQPDGERVVVQMVVKRPTYMDKDLAKTLLEKKGVLEQYSVFRVEVIDEDKAAEVLTLAGLDDEEHGFVVTSEPTADTIREAYYDKLISDAEYAEIITEEEEYSLYPRKGHK